MPAASAAVKLKEDASACQKGATIESDGCFEAGIQKESRTALFLYAKPQAVCDHM